MEDLERIVSQNIIKFRKNSKLTQSELAEKLNYSDKSVSKWERGESFPDLFILKQMADLFGVSVDSFFLEREIIKKEKINKPEISAKKRVLISLLSAGLVWLVAVSMFVLLRLFIPAFSKAWIMFIIAIPASAIVLLVFSCVWHKKRLQLLFITILMWTIPLAVCLGFTFSMSWLLFFVPIPLQVLAILWYFFKR